MDISKYRKKTNGSGFTLLEIIVVIVIIGIMAAVALPKYTGAVERSRASEGTYILGTLLSAQERYFLENGSFANGNVDSGNNWAGLDVEVPAPKYFGTPTVSNACASGSACATVVRTGGTFTLTIDRDGVISCADSGCAAAGF